jgi:hypothetical protein
MEKTPEYTVRVTGRMDFAAAKYMMGEIVALYRRVTYVNCKYCKGPLIGEQARLSGWCGCLRRARSAFGSHKSARTEALQSRIDAVVARNMEHR